MYLYKLKKGNDAMLPSTSFVLQSTDLDYFHAISTGAEAIEVLVQLAVHAKTQAECDERKKQLITHIDRLATYAHANEHDSAAKLN